MQIRALKAFSTGTFAMEQYEIRDVDDTLAASLIAQGLAAEVGGSGGGVLLVTEIVKPNNYRELSEPFDVINNALIEGKSVRLQSGNYVQGTIVGTFEDYYEEGGQVAIQKNVIATVVDDTNSSSKSLCWSTHSNANPSRKITS